VGLCCFRLFCCFCAVLPSGVTQYYLFCRFEVYEDRVCLLWRGFALEFCVADIKDDFLFGFFQLGLWGVEASSRITNFVSEI